jgi:sodium/hydrogen exchanger 8
MAEVDAVTVATEQCISDTEATSPARGQALLARRTTLERVKTGEWREESVEQDMSGKKHAHAISDQSLSAELAQLTKVLPVQDLEAMLQTARDLRSQNMQPTNITDPEELPILAPNPKTPEYVLPESPDNEEETHILAKFIVVPISAAFFIIYNVQTVMEKYEITAIPETAVVIGYGVVLGWFMKTYAALEFFEDQEAWAKINTAMLNFMLLPIIIFAGGWSLRRHDFASQLPYILLFAVGGTAVSTCVIAALMHASGICVMWRTAFCYASLISATDPVATLTTYSKLKVHPLLNIMVFGESTINDAVAIVLFRIFNSNELMGDPTKGQALPLGAELIRNISWGIFKTFFGSVIFGSGLGMLYTMIARGADMRTNKKGQILVIFVSCYLTYALAETFHLSGIIAETFCSLLMGIYMRPHLSKEGCVLTTFFVKQISTLADSAVFLVVGVSVVQLTPHGWRLGLWVSLFCLIARLVATIPIAYVTNGLKAARGRASELEAEGWHLLETRHIFMMWHAGLRGGIALALAWEMGAWVDIVEGKVGYRHALQTATFLVILAFLIIFGGSTTAFLNYFKIELGKDYPEDYLSKTEDAGLGLTGIIKRIDTEILTPLLVGKHFAEEDDESETAHIDAEHEVGKQVDVKSFCHR